MSPISKCMILLLCFLVLLEAKIINVPADVTTIQDAIDASHNGDTILVSHGLYYENINFKGKAITVSGCFLIDGDTTHISRTIIDGSKHDCPFSGSVVSFISGEDTTSVLSGLTIRGGSGTDLEREGTRDGGGILIKNSGAKITNNIITDNTIQTSYKYRWSAGIAAYGGADKTIIIRDNQIIGNRIISDTGGGAGVGIRTKGSLLFEKNIVRGNICTCTVSAWGGGIFIDGADGNTGNSILINNIIIANQIESSWGNARGAGMMILDASPEILKNIISGNQSNCFGGGIYFCNGCIPMYPRLINNTITGNQAAIGGGLCIQNEVNIEVINTIIWKNQATLKGDEIYRDELDSLLISYSNVKGGWEGEGNINIDPYFCQGSFFYLSDSSLCIDAGDPQLLDEEDPDNPGYPLWPAQGTLRSDMGAFGGCRWSELKTIDVCAFVPDLYELFQNYPNPFNATTTIRYALGVTSNVELSIYNLLGQKVVPLVSARHPAGKYEVQWDAADFASGVYLYKLHTDNGFSQTRKLVFLR